MSPAAPPPGSPAQGSPAPVLPGPTPAVPLRVALPKGRMQEGVLTLLRDAGVAVRLGARGYRPAVALPGAETKLLKPQNAVEMLHHGTRDLGFAGADWVAELGAELVEVLDLGLDPVRLVVAAPHELLGPDGPPARRLPARRLRLATEYVQLAKAWVADQGLDAEILRAYGATEVFPPEDADLILDNTATGETLAANGLSVVAEVMRSSTRMYASPAAWADPARRAKIEDLALLIRAVLDARRRVMLEVNVPAERLEALVAILPCMREPTVAPLHGARAFAVKAAVPRDTLAALIPALKAAGGTDVVVSTLAQIVP